MRICIVRSNKNAYSETFIRDQIKGLSQLAQVDTLYSGWLPERSEDGKLLSPLPYWMIQKMIKKITGERNNWFSHYGLKKFFKKNTPDVVLANYGISGAHLTPLCSKLGLPLVVHFHGFDATSRDILAEYSEKYKEMFAYASAIIAVSNEMRQKLIDLGAAPESVHLNPYGIDMNVFRTCSPSLNPPNFVSVGRFTPKKAPELVIKAFNLVAKVHPEAKLTMIGGDDGLLDRCKQLVAELGLQKQVNLPGILERNTVQKILSESRAFIQHSITAPDGDMEGTPVAILEASASGLPIVATLHGGIKDAVIHGKTGLLVEENDFETMGKYMIYLIENPNRAKEMGAEGRHRMEDNYALEKQICRLYSILERAAEKRNYE